MTTYRTVVGVDGSEGSARALRWAVNEAHTRGGTVQAVMTYDWAGTEAAMLAGLGPEGERKHAEGVLADAVAAVRLEFPRVPVATEVLLGNAAQKLTEAARDADLLVVGSHGHGRLYHAVLGSVSEACIRHATCPVVVIPAHDPPPRHVTVATQEPATGEPAV